jgi:4-azaleucine resistance transporter AzlC
MPKGEDRFGDGVRAAIPIVLGYLPVGMAFGVLARRAGLAPSEAVLMSLVVYAGASQFLAVEMLFKGLAGLPVVLATFFINLRHLLMSSTLAPRLQGVRLPLLSLLAGQLTDESFAVAAADLGRIENRPLFLLGLQMTSHAAWVSGSAAGSFFGSLVDGSGYGLPFALPALFICLLVLQIRSSIHLAVAGLAAVLSVVLRTFLPGNGYIIGAAVLASAAGLAIEKVRDGGNERRGEKAVKKGRGGR